MTPAELAVRLDALGLNRDDAAAALHVSTSTVRNWLTGRSPIPPGITDDLDDLDDLFAYHVIQTAACGVDAASVTTWRTTERMWTDRPHLKPMPARWHRHVVAAARAQVPRGFLIEFAEDVD